METVIGFFVFVLVAILLEKGHVVIEGDPAEVVRVHEERSARAKAERDAAIAAGRPVS